VTGIVVVKDYRNLPSWKEARLLVCALLDWSFALSQRSESNSIAAEIERLSVSVLDNLARAYEGNERRSFITKGRRTIAQLEEKLGRAAQRGIMTSSDSLRLTRELYAVKRYLSNTDL